MHTRICDGPLEWNSSNVAVMSQANREGSLAHLINDTSPLMSTPTGQESPQDIMVIITIHISIGPSIYPFI